MGLLSDILLFPVTGPVRGLYFILEQIRDQVDAEESEAGSQIQEELMDLAIRYELGEIAEQAYAEQESALLERLNEVRNAQEYWLETEEREREGDEASSESEHVGYPDES